MNARLGTVLGFAATMGIALASPMAANASTPNTANTWKALSIGSAILSVIGASNHDNGLAAIGAVGAIYSGVRYEQDAASLDNCGNGYDNGVQVNIDGGYRGDDHGYNGNLNNGNRNDGRGNDGRNGNNNQGYGQDNHGRR